MTEPAKMRVKEIRIFPIKSIRGMSLPSHRASAVGFEHDRIFMLQRVSDSKNMHVPHFPSMCLFTTEFAPNSEDPDKVLVRFGLDHVFDQPERKLSGNEVLEVPIRPDVAGLKSVEYKLHTSVARGYVMPDEICRWFSERFGFEVRLNYVGLNKREVLGNLNPNAPRTWVGDPDPKKEADKMMSPSGGGWLNGLKAGVGNVLGTVASYSGIDAYKGVDDGLTFTDLAAFLVVNYKSHVDVSGRVQTDIDVEKFRPNIVVDGVDEECGAWSEDYWGEIAIGPEERGTRIAFTSNCARCASVNVDYATGRMHEGPEGQLLKSMQGDRRVDPGFKYSPIFGRYGFLSQKNGQRPEKPITIRVGDEVQITKRNDKRTHFYWPNLGT
ncbi:hypothetical protein OHC33_004438 [Knufia fluminis]|uniref:MOSC domain-containing protein n=1 Tax=Knufia fluminis TaxID=191047 RepID=A0AAN8EFX6_9EURO|nr:hypothetical protein OHC33_004438 [Knufia fluminis]